MIEGRVADVIVIGAGIVGAACAHELARHGLQTLVVDDQRGGATAVGMGHLLVLDDNAAELALSNRSLKRWREWGKEMPEGCAYQGNGTLWLAENPEEMAVAEHKYRVLGEHDIACELLTGAALSEAEPMLRQGLHGALKITGDGIVYAPNAARWLLQRNPLRVLQRREQVIEVQGNRVRLADGKWLQADAVILANGIHATQLCPELPIEPKKGHLAITDRYPGLVRHTLVELGYVTSAHHATGPSVAFNVQPRPTGQLFIGSSRQFGNTDAAIDPTMLGQMLQRAQHFLPTLADLNLIRSWTGFRAATPDGLPMIGEHPQQPGLWLAVGHEGLGVTTAPATAELIVAQLLKRPPPIATTPYRPERLLGNAAHA